MSTDIILFILAIVCFLVDAFRSPLNLKTSITFTPIGFACITAALWVV